MATSIRDLVRALEHEAPYTAGRGRPSRDAAGALSELGRGLRQLTSDGLDLDLNGPRESLVRDLAESCAQNAAALRLDRLGRLTSVAGGIADVIGVLRGETGRDQRWAIAAELASAARVLTTYAAEGDGRRTADLVWTHLTARALIVQAMRDSPSVQSQAVLDRALPAAVLAPDLPPAWAAMESLSMISDQLRRSAAGLSRRPSLLEVFAVTRAAESTTRYASAAAATLAGQPRPQASPPAAIWAEIRDRLQPFTTAAPLQRHDHDHDLGRPAQRAHSELRREFGSADQPQVLAGGRVKEQAVRHLQMMVNEVPAIADHLATAVEQLADHADLHALATRLPFREQRLQPFLATQPVVADRFDVAPIMQRLADAAILAAELATTLDRVGGAASAGPQPGLQAAHADRAAWQRLDPHAGLVPHAGEGRRPGNANSPADPATTVTAATATRFELMHIREADHTATADWEIESS